MEDLILKFYAITNILVAQGVNPEDFLMLTWNEKECENIMSDEKAITQCFYPIDFLALDFCPKLETHKRFKVDNWIGEKFPLRFKHVDCARSYNMVQCVLHKKHFASNYCPLIKKEYEKISLWKQTGENLN